MAKRHLVFKDTLALLSVFAVTCVLAVLTWLIFRSYSQHQKDAAARWKRRGEESLVHNNPAAAVYDLRTSLGYAPDQRDTEVKLAQALVHDPALSALAAYRTRRRSPWRLRRWARRRTSPPAPPRPRPGW